MAVRTRKPRLSDADLLAALSANNNVRRYAARSLAISESLLGDRLSKMQRAGVKVPRSGWRPQKRGPEFRGQGPESGQRRAESRGPQAVAVTVGHSPCSAVRSPLSARLADILAFNSKLAGHPLVDAVEELQRRQAERRRIEIHEAWWRTRAELVDFPAPTEMSPGIFRQSFTLDINQQLSRGDIERIFSLGVRAMHEARGEVADVVNGVKMRGARKSHSVQPVPNPQSLPGRSGATTKD